MKLRIAILGFGNVGRALARLLRDRPVQLPFTVTAIVTRSHGWWVDAGGVDLERALSSESFPSALTNPPVADLPCDVVVELTTLEPRTGQPAFDHLMEALRSGKHAVTANKGPIAHGFRELQAAAAASGRELRFEATVADCLPVFSLRRGALPLAHIRAIRGVVSSTTNHILSAAARGVPFADALAEAQRLGIAEADPSNDLEGWDAAAKATILANVLMGADVRIDNVRRTRIGEGVAREAEQAAREGARVRPLIEIDRVAAPPVDHGRRQAGPASRTGSPGRRRPGVPTSAHVEVDAAVGPRRLDPLDPLYAVDGWSMALELDTDLAGRLVVQLHDPHVEQVAYAVLTDLLDISALRARE